MLEVYSGERVDLCYTRVEVVGRFFFFQAEDGIRDLVRSRGLGDVYKRQIQPHVVKKNNRSTGPALVGIDIERAEDFGALLKRMDQSPLTIEQVEPGSPLFAFLF